MHWMPWNGEGLSGPGGDWGLKLLRCRSIPSTYDKQHITDHDDAPGSGVAGQDRD